MNNKAQINQSTEGQRWPFSPKLDAARRAAEKMRIERSYDGIETPSGEEIELFAEVDRLWNEWVRVGEELGHIVRGKEAMERFTASQKLGV